MTLKNFCVKVNAELNASVGDDWAKCFIQNRLALQTLYLKGLVLSTAHGADIFDNILNCLNGAEWEEKGEYGNNFRKFIKQNVDIE